MNSHHKWGGSLNTLEQIQGQDGNVSMLNAEGIDQGRETTTREQESRLAKRGRWKWKRKRVGKPLGRKRKLGVVPRDQQNLGFKEQGQHKLGDQISAQGPEESLKGKLRYTHQKRALVSPPKALFKERRQLTSIMGRACFCGLVTFISMSPIENLTPVRPKGGRGTSVVRKETQLQSRIIRLFFSKRGKMRCTYRLKLTGEPLRYRS